MGAQLKVYFAIETPRTTFFTVTADAKRVCSVEVQHQVGATASFCEHCGAKVGFLAIETPTDAFKALCAAQNVDPSYAFHQLRDDGWVWTDPAGREYTIGWRAMEAFHDAESPRQTTVYALGIAVLSQWDEEPESRSKAISFSMDDLYKLSDPLNEIAEAFKIPNEPRLYLQVYVSY